MFRTIFTKRCLKKAFVFALGFVFSLGVAYNFCYAAEPRQMTLGTAGSAGTWYVKGSLIAKILSAHVPDLRVTAVVSPGEERENIRRIHARQMELGFCLAPASWEGYHGLGVFAPTKHDTLMWFNEQEGAYLPVVHEDSGIRKLEDLRGKTIALPGKGTAVYKVLTEDVLPLYGLKKGDYKEYLTPASEGARAFIDGQVDCWIYSTTLLENPHVTKMMAARKVYFLSFDDRAMPFVEKNVGHYLKDFETHRGIKQEKPITMLNSGRCLIVGSYLDEELVYNLTKAFFENIEEFHAASPTFKRVTLENAIPQKGKWIPFHPGALRYYKEKNIKGWDNPMFRWDPSAPR